MLRNIQRAIISTYLYGELEQLEQLEGEYFDIQLLPFIKKINSFIEQDIPMSILNIKLEESLNGHKLEKEYLEIIVQCPLVKTLMNKYYKYLKEEKRKRFLLNSF